MIFKMIITCPKCEKSEKLSIRELAENSKIIKYECGLCIEIHTTMLFKYDCSNCRQITYINLFNDNPEFRNEKYGELINEFEVINKKEIIKKIENMFEED